MCGFKSRLAHHGVVTKLQTGHCQFILPPKKWRWPGVVKTPPRNLCRLIPVPAAAYDGHMPRTQLTIKEVGQEVGRCLLENDRPSALRLSFRFIETFDKATDEERSRMVTHRPQTTGDLQFDALLAGVAEFSCAKNGLLAPSWVNDQDLFLEQWWFVSGIESLHADALVSSPISLARRGVFVTQGALEYA